MSRLPSHIEDAVDALHLPSMPLALLQLLEAARDDSSPAPALAALALRDPSLSARLLSVAHSAAYRREGGAADMTQAVQRLGTRLVHGIAACLVVQNLFHDLPGGRPDALAGFWRHALLVAELARAIAADVGLPRPEEAHLAGLLHDIGELMLLGGLGQRYAALLRQCEGGEGQLGAIEQAALATDHASVGAWLVDRWQLPSLVADAILFHHHGAAQVAGADLLTRCVWAAHRAADADAGAAAGAGLAEAAALLGREPAALAALLAQSVQHVASLAEALGLPAAPVGQTLPSLPPPAEVAAAVADSGRAGLVAAVAAAAALQPLHLDAEAMGSEAELLDAARASAQLLFGVGAIAFFLGEGNAPRLAALDLPGQAPQLQQLAILLDGSPGLCAEAAMRRQLRCSFEAAPGAAGPLAISDLQRARALGSSGLLCVPMTDGAALLGLMVCGLTAVQAGRLRPHAALLRSHAALTVSALQAWRRGRDRRLAFEAALIGRQRLQGRQRAHELANPLGIMKTYLRLVERRLPEASDLGAELAILGDEIDRMAVLARRLGEGETPADADADAEGLDVAGLIEGLGQLYGEALFGAVGLRLALDLPPPAPSPRARAQVDRAVVAQTVLNLWTNAAEAAPAGSAVLTACIGNVRHEGRSYVEITVSDEGPGLPEDVLGALFQPLLAGRRAGHAGLGLSIVAGLVHRVGGHITCRSVAQRGTRFSVLLPQVVKA